MADHHVEPLLRRPRVQDVSGRSRSTLYKNIKEGLWTRPVSLGPRAVAWPAHEVAALNAARIAGKSDDEIRDLVTKLHADRTPVRLPEIRDDGREGFARRDCTSTSNSERPLKG